MTVHELVRYDGDRPVVEWLEDDGNFNRLPAPAFVIAEQEYLQRSTIWSPRYYEFRQVYVDPLHPERGLRNAYLWWYPAPGYLLAHQVWYDWETPRVFEGGKLVSGGPIRGGKCIYHQAWWRCGCPHVKRRPINEDEISAPWMRPGRSYTVSVCEACGHIQAIDSSD